ncbi:DUF6794 domain-containing protein [Portibacter marinus]|uniref:DUF6794 domain-containing protein n=1 Tax=Portibacter marinus TaxID=2898660 RepID=UPI001F1C74B6|nr:DUF6794 domain-containing protein [Portibacter marinus]
MKYIFISLFFFVVGQSYTQDPVHDEKSFEERYERNIKKSRINGVYIPKDLDEAMSELLALSSKEALEKFKNGEEVVVAKKLHFGLGRWMIYNWNFYEGSRFSHFLSQKGITHPDDQAQLVIVSLHRKLNGRDLDVEGQIQTFIKAREEERNTQLKVLKQETRIRPNEKG